MPDEPLWGEGAPQLMAISTFFGLRGLDTTTKKREMSTNKIMELFIKIISGAVIVFFY